MVKKISSALISVYHKTNLEPLVQFLDAQGVKLYSTGGTLSFIQELGIEATAVEDLTKYPSIFGGRVKTLHPSIFGGILYRRDNNKDVAEASEFNIPPIDLVVVDLYPFENTVAEGAPEADIIEKIDIGGISLIRAAAKNYQDTVVISAQSQYDELLSILSTNAGSTTLTERKRFAAQSFAISSHYDSAIYNYFNKSEDLGYFKQSAMDSTELRYGENPHQSAQFFGQLADLLEQLNGKALSYNNLVDIDAAMTLIAEFDGDTAFAILKHTNACGVATAENVKDAYLKAYAADTLSAFGGVLISNCTIDLVTAEEMNELFFEVLIAPEFEAEALNLLKSKKNRILLKSVNTLKGEKQFKSLLNGVIEQDRDNHTDALTDIEEITEKKPSTEELEALLFASKICKHSKSNAIIIAKDGQMLASGVGQTSRVDAVNQAIEKAGRFGFSLAGAVLASDAFFPFPDSVEIANEAGISSFIQPGGSVKDQLSVDFCNENGLSMVFTGKRHFKH
jgi:phosphoribosylaminoimidazolecarboxamide formyltransferase / IMP cyclohydrolase